MIGNQFLEVPLNNMIAKISLIKIEEPEPELPF